MKNNNKMFFGVMTLFAIVAISAVAIHTVHKTHKKIVCDCNSDIDWDI